MLDIGADLRETVERAAPLLLALDDEASSRPRAPGKWSPRQIIGHLIDSACNNHARFVKAQLQDDLICPGYEQDAWVAVQRYQDVPWSELVALWAAYNRHIGRIMSTTPEPALSARRTRHNLNVIAWQPVPAESPATLAYFMRDYVGHLHHHLRQVLGERWTGLRAKAEG
jgi:DinB superfamily